MALQSARAPNLGLDVDNDTLRLADYYLDRAAYDRQNRRGNFAGLPGGSLYTYQPGTRNGDPVDDGRSDTLPNVPGLET